VTDDIVTQLEKYNSETGIDYELAQLHALAIAEIEALRIQYGYLETQCSYWRERALND
jgi:hypothetical protein